MPSRRENAAISVGICSLAVRLFVIVAISDKTGCSNMISRLKSKLVDRAAATSFIAKTESFREKKLSSTAMSEEGRQKLSAQRD